jgi:tRNA pseudouridine38-40 synthase
VLRATLEYDGGRYRGWQSQVNARTVQGVLAAAVREVLGEGVRIQGAGRTDAGVHALGQVASLHLSQAPRQPLGPLRRALNDKLPFDVNVLDLREAPPHFHARHDALLRIYRYRISRRRTAFGKPFVWWVKDRLDAAAMERAAARLVGRHDYASFCDNSEGHDSTLVEVSYARVEVPAETPDLVLFRICASHYLWKMVRRIVGVLVEIGTGRLDEEAVARFFTEKSPKIAEWTAPASGLFLESVVYPGDPPPREVSPWKPAF